MTKKDFIVVASVFANLPKDSEFDDIVNALTVEFARVYPAFNPDKFRASCYEGV